jgi:hypothetical protein
VLRGHVIFSKSRVMGGGEYQLFRMAATSKLMLTE